MNTNLLPMDEFIKLKTLNKEDNYLYIKWDQELKKLFVKELECCYQEKLN